VQELERLPSSRLPVVEIEHVPEPFAALNRPIGLTARSACLDQSVPYTLVISFSMIMRNVLPKRPAKRCLAEKNRAIHAFVFY
jgi:hypothetical protein